ncbi:MAG: hypothetical protein MRECE_32c008 [Mycoplasmataceae bacterium CE_OT135]|nr:MAG: hypothetical protein MRECE_32c008 [Mycoplasmataceae bacterium CE_OT135]
MTKEKWTVKVERKSSLFGYMGGGEFDDLDQIANELGTSKETLLNSDINKRHSYKKNKD